MVGRNSPSRFWIAYKIGVGVYLGLLPYDAQARVYDLYRADYPKGAFCSAIAGACASDLDLENSFFQNPAALTAGPPNWNFDGDYTNNSNLEPGMKGTNDVTEAQFMGGFGWAGEKFGAGFSFSGRREQVGAQVSLIDDQGFSRNLPLQTSATILELHLPLAYRVDPSLSVGISLNGSFYSQSLAVNGAPAFAGSGDGELRLGFSVGAIKTINEKVRLGSWWKSPTTSYDSVQFVTQAFSNQLTYNEDLALHFPWIWATGISFAPWEDARTFFLDLDLIGNTFAGTQLTYDTFVSAVGDKGTRFKGRSVVIEPRLGYRMPWHEQSQGTLLLGTYYETSRWEDLSGRLHLTGGVSYKVLSWLELMGGLDVAKDFFQLFVTFR